jgi:hypothetical protein
VVKTTRHEFKPTDRVGRHTHQAKRKPHEMEHRRSRFRLGPQTKNSKSIQQYEPIVGNANLRQKSEQPLRLSAAEEVSGRAKPVPSARRRTLRLSAAEEVSDRAEPVPSARRRTLRPSAEGEEVSGRAEPVPSAWRRTLRLSAAEEVSGRAELAPSAQWRTLCLSAAGEEVSGRARQALRQEG